MSELVRLQLGIELHGIIFSSFMVVVLALERYKKNSHRRTLIWCLQANIVVLLSDMAAAWFDGSQAPYGPILNQISNYALYLFQYIFVAFMSIYIFRVILPHMDKVRNEWMQAVHWIALLGMIGLIINIFTGMFFSFDEFNFYQRGPFFPAAIIIAALGMAIEIWAVFRYRNILPQREFLILAAYFICPVAGMILQYHYKGFSFQNIGITISVCGVFVGYTMDSFKTKERQKQILLQSQAYLLNSQIQPHFIFNCLNTIEALVEEDPRQAELAIQHFGKYLRKGLNLRTNDSLISIQEELDYVRNYLYMEKLRFGDKLNIKYSIDENVDFEIPFLTLQPLVENAVRHGIRKKVTGGTVLISIQEGQRWNTIQVIDDGVGMDLSNLKKKNEEPTSNGVGLKNVEERIRILCDGRIDFVSAPGKGMTVTIHIPKSLS